MSLKGFRPQYIAPAANAAGEDGRQANSLKRFQPEPLVTDEDLPDFLNDAAPARKFDAGRQPFGWRPPRK